MYVELARQSGAAILTGGDRPSHPDLSDRPFLPPTVIGGVDPHSRVVREEIFGPVLVVQKAGDLEDAIKTANAGAFGLAAGIFTSDLDAALLASRKLRAGTVWLNTWNKTYPEFPTGGFKDSGLGRELGIEGMETYLEPKTVQLNPHRSR